MEIPQILATIWDRTATTQSALVQDILTQLRWDILRRTVMDSTTWLGMCSSGVGIGMRCRMLVAAIPTDLPGRRVTVCYAEAFGTPTPTTRGAPVATLPARSATATALAFGV